MLKFKMKLELLALQYKLKKIKTEYNWEQKKEHFMDELEKLRKNLSEKEKQAGEKMENFREEMQNAFSHFRKAFQFNEKN
jgi:hypothetical protein